jgi:hypothetical protein
MPRPETGPLAGRVVDEKGRPVDGALVAGQYASAESRALFREMKTGGDGRFETERSLDPLVLSARTADGTRAGIVRLGADAVTTEIAIGPTASASGRLLDLNGKPLVQTKLEYGIRVYMGESENSPSCSVFGGAPRTDAQGRFTINGLIPGQSYNVHVIVENEWRPVTTVTPKDAKAIDLGDVRVDPEPRMPYVPPTPAAMSRRGPSPSVFKETTTAASPGTRSSTATARS